ncbi:MAG: putative superfamily hydrolase [Frankiales bacterium]|nr:putative superfamily hydrolase [Frankiales bacterium]
MARRDQKAGPDSLGLVTGFAAGVQVVGVDGDDTLWRCQDAFDDADAALASLLRPDLPAEQVSAAQHATERRNLPVYGYGVKGWALSALETGLDLTGGELSPSQVRGVLDLGRGLLTGAVEVLPGAAEALVALARSHRVVLVTKGDLVDQRRKLAASGLGGCFDHVEVVPEKDEAVYRELLAFLDCRPEEFLMVGNSEVSDIHPVLDLGGWAVHVPYRTTWVHERAAESRASARKAVVASLTEVPALLQADGDASLIEGCT